MRTISSIHIAIVLSACFSLQIPLRGSAQIGPWSAKQALTDSGFTSMNSVIFQAENKDLLFWEREGNPGVSEIWMRDIRPFPLTDEQLVLSQPNVALTHPVVMKTDYGLALPYFYLFYQTSESNSTDIKYIKYYKDGTFSAPFNFSSLPGNDVNLHIRNEYHPSLTWENGDKVLVAFWDYLTETFSSPIVLDSDIAYSPACFELNYNYKIGWLKRNGNDTYLKYAGFDYQTDTVKVTGIDSVYIDGDADLLTGSNFEFWGDVVLAFQKRPAGSDKWGISMMDFGQSPPEISDIHSPNHNYTEPVIWPLIIFAKGFDNTNIAFTSDSLVNPEIFSTSNTYGMLFSNLSGYAGQDRKANVYFTFPGGNLLRTQLTWESSRNGHWTVFRSYFDVTMDGIDETSGGNGINISPNPFSSYVSLSIKNILPGETIRILNINGQCVRYLRAKSNDDGTCNTLWDGNDMYGNKLPNGTYIVCIQTNDGFAGKLIVKSE
jgi:hypothetical protein